jgi:toxin ParE1/3/4
VKRYKVYWNDDAVVTLEAIIDYVEAFDPDAAVDLALRLYNAAASLDAFPNRGRPSSGGTRELINVTPYVIRYDIVGDRVEILRIRHMARSEDT